MGRPEVVAPFRAAGLVAFGVQSGNDALEQLEALSSSELAVLFYTDDLHAQLVEAGGRRDRTSAPYLVMLPTGAAEHGLDRLRELVTRSLGADLFARGPERSGNRAPEGRGL